MTKQQIEALSLGIAPIDDRVILVVESGLEWVLENTTLKFNMENEEELKALPSRVKLFLTKFFDIQMMSTGVTSESAEGLSQSFDRSNKNDLIWQFAEELLGKWLKGRVEFVAASSRWR